MNDNNLDNVLYVIDAFASMSHDDFEGGFVEVVFDDEAGNECRSDVYIPEWSRKAAEAMRRLHAENERLRAENEAMAKDAARYVWIRDEHQYSSRGWEIVQEVDREGWDEAIDSAMEQIK